MALNWDNLSQYTQQEYYQRAVFLLDNGYIRDIKVEKLAKQIFQAEMDERRDDEKEEFGTKKEAELVKGIIPI